MASCAAAPAEPCGPPSGRATSPVTSLRHRPLMPPTVIPLNALCALSSASGLRYGPRMVPRPSIARIGLLLTAMGCQGEPKGIPLLPPAPSAFDPVSDTDSETGSTDTTDPNDSGPPADSGEPDPQWDEGPPAQAATKRGTMGKKEQPNGVTDFHWMARKSSTRAAEKERTAYSIIFLFFEN